MISAAVFAALFTYAQDGNVGINTSAPATTLHITGTNDNGANTSKDGILIPRVNNLSVSGLQNGQLLFLVNNIVGTGTAVNPQFTKGFHYWDSSAGTWKPLDTIKEPWNNQGTSLATTSDDEKSNSNTETIYHMGVVGFGIETPRGRIHVHSDGNKDAIFSSLSSVPTDDMDLDLYRSRGTSVTSPGLVLTGDRLGGVRYNGYNNAAFPSATNTVAPFSTAAEIAAEADDTGTVSATSMPGKLIFATTPDGTIHPVNRMIIKSDGKIGINTAVPLSNFEINGSLGTKIRSMGSGTVDNNDHTVLVTGDITVPQANATNKGRVYRLVKGNPAGAGMHNITFTNNSLYIPGDTTNSGSYGLSGNDFGRGIEVQSDGSSWILVSRF